MEKNYNVKEYFENMYEDSLAEFHELIRWGEEDYKEYAELLEDLKSSETDSETTKDKGDRLENIVAFIFKKSFFFEVYRNVKTATNEIDEVITLSKKREICSGK